MRFDEEARECWHRIIAQSGQPDEEAAAAEISQTVREAVTTELLRISLLITAGGTVESINDHLEARLAELASPGRQ